MEYDYFNKEAFLEFKIGTFEKNHFEKLLEIRTMSGDHPLLHAELEALIEGFAKDIQQLKTELRQVVADREEAEKDK